MALFSILIAALLMAAAAKPAEPVFTRVSLEPEGLCFDSPVELDWEAMARREFKEFPIDDPPRDQIVPRGERRRIYSFFTDLPKPFKGQHFYLLAETGTQPIRPQRLFVSFHYRYHPPAKPEPMFRGQLCLPVPDAVHDAGFVATSGVPLSWQKTPATLSRSGSTTRVRLPSGSAPMPPAGLDGGLDEVKAAYILSSAGLKTRYLFVRRVPDTQCRRLCCEFTYDIFRWESGLPVVASSAYGCDI